MSKLNENCVPENVKGITEDGFVKFYNRVVDMIDGSGLYKSQRLNLIDHLEECLQDSDLQVVKSESTDKGLNI